jgi:hypothetical protein
MCKSTDTSGHTFVDTPEDGSQCSGEYTSGTGERRQWQHCTGCGNVQNRAVTSLDGTGPNPDSPCTRTDGCALPGFHGSACRDYDQTRDATPRVWDPETRTVQPPHRTPRIL